MHSAGGLVGRGGELGTLDRLVDRARRSGAHVVAISGEPGIGKSRLLAELGALAEESQWLVLEGRATEFERGVPFAVLVDALDDYLASLHPRRLEPLGKDRLAELTRAFPALGGFAMPRGLETERYRIHRAVRALLELLAGHTPLVLMLDDVHWADVASLELLLHLLRRSPNGVLLVALAFRPAQTPTEFTTQLAAASRDGGATLMTLGPLTRAQTAELLGPTLAGDRLDVVFEQSGGNPFFAQQIAHSPQLEQAVEPTGEAEGVPLAVIAAIERELGALTESGRRLLEGAAVAGDPFEPGLAGAAAEIEDAAALRLLDELLSLHLVRPTEVPSRFRFRHPIVRRAVYNSAGRGWRLAAHRRVAAVLGGRGATASELAHHVEAAAVPGDRAAVALLADAGHAIADRAPRIAARRFEAALRLLPANNPAARLGLLVPLATSLGAAGDLAASHRAVEEALSLVPPDQAPTRVRLVALCAAIEHLLGRHEHAHARLLGEQSRLPDGRSPEAVTLALELSADRQWIGDWEGMAEWAERAVAGATAVASRPLAAAAEALVCFAYCILGRIADAERHRIAAGALIDSLDDAQLAERLDACLWLGVAEYQLERYEDGVRHLERGIVMSRATGQGQFLIEMRSIQAWCLTALARLEEASAVIEEALDAARLAANAQATSVALWVRCWLAGAIGDLDLGLRSGEESVAIASTVDENIILWMSRAHLASICVEVGEHERCVRELERAGAPEFANFGVELTPRWCEALVRASLGLGRIDDAERWVARAEAFIDGHDLPVAVAAASRARAHLLVAQGDPRAAAERALAAAAAQLSRGVRIEAARSGVLAGQALAAAGERERAAAELERAHAELDAVGAHRWRDEAARELRRLGRRVARTGTPGAGAGAGVASLSGRELEVAELVAAGCTNNEVAARLFVSEKTVEKHLSKVFEKLDVSRRRAVAARLTEKGESSTA